MLILGEKYKFTTLELSRLSEKFENINTVLYKDRDSNEVINEIESILNQNKFLLIVLNTKVKVNDELIKYLTNLKFQVKSKKFKIISIEHFLEEYLFKCYIPEDNSDLHYLDDIKGYTTFQKCQKAFIDTGAMVCLLVVFPFFRRTAKKKIIEQSPGSLYYKQLRVGMDNREFECVKFRSMHEDAEKNGAAFAKEGDSRVFEWGVKMRKSRIDEIPQLFNILKREMNFVGPRPERRYWIEKDFESAIPYYNQRHIVAPGITGWAQVMYPYGEGIEDARQKLMYDLYYIKHWSFWLEVKIIWMTIMVVSKKKGI